MADLSSSLNSRQAFLPFVPARLAAALQEPVTARGALAALTLVPTTIAGAATWAAIPEPTPAALAALALTVSCVLWIAGGAATALIGLVAGTPAPMAPPRGWRPVSRTAILVLMCNEDAGPVARRAALMARALERSPLAGMADIFVLSDSRAENAETEAACFADLVADGTIRYRRRARNEGRKPGNIADWIAASGGAYAGMLVLDSDSRMSAARIARLVYRMEREPRTGLIQAGIGLAPATTRFGRAQRAAGRLLSPAFGAGLARWSGRSGNYWGHNALIRVAAFREAAMHLPVLPGAAPMGGPILSHDFVEAAYLRRAGWSVVLEPDVAGSAEEAPQTLSEFHRRDRRWCQGNLQHLRVIGAPGLSPTSRLHLASGIAGYLVAPAWLGLVVLLAGGAIPVGSLVPAAIVAALLLTPKAVALVRFARLRAPNRMRVALRAALGELALSALAAPLIMLRQTASVAAVAMGRDCGWKDPAKARRPLPTGMPEALTGAAILALALAVNPASAPWLVPILLPLLGAPWLILWLEGAA